MCVHMYVGVCVWVDGRGHVPTTYVPASSSTCCCLAPPPSAFRPPLPPLIACTRDCVTPTTTTASSRPAASHCSLPRLECTPRSRTAKTCSFDRQPGRRFNMKIALWAITCGLGLDSPSHCAFSLPHKCTQEPHLSPSSARPCPCFDSSLGPLRQYAAATRAV